MSIFEPRQVERGEFELLPCRWEDGNGICMLDGCACDGGDGCHEPKKYPIAERGV